MRRRAGEVSGRKRLLNEGKMVSAVTGGAELERARRRVERRGKGKGNALIILFSTGGDLHLVLVTVTSTTLHAHPQRQRWILGQLLSASDLLRSEASERTRASQQGVRQTVHSARLQPELLLCQLALRRLSSALGTQRGAPLPPSSDCSSAGRSPVHEQPLP